MAEFKDAIKSGLKEYLDGLKKAVDGLINLSVLTAAAATVEANAAPKKGRPADPASIYAVDMVRPSSPQVHSRVFDHVA